MPDDLSEIEREVREVSERIKSRDPVSEVAIETIRVLRGTLKTAVRQNPRAAIDDLVRYFEMIGIEPEDRELQELVDRWRACR